MSLDEELELLKERTAALERDMEEYKAREKIRERAVDDIADRLLKGLA